MEFKVKTRFSAFITHLAICAIIAILSMVMVFFVWYPTPLHIAVGVTNIFLMLLAIDVIVGPVLTAIVFEPKKSSLKFDLTVIALLQISALVYGMNAVFEGRPAFIVFNVDRFDIARAYEIDPKSAETAKKNNNESAKVSWLKPKWVGAVASKDSIRRRDIMFSSAFGGADWPLLPELYVPLTNVKQEMLTRAKDLTTLSINKAKQSEIATLISEWQSKNVKWLPLKGKTKHMIVLIDAQSADVVKVVDINPWD